MPDPLAWLGEASAKYGPIAAGLVIGTAAKYSLTMGEGKSLTWRGVIADLLLLGMLGLLAIVIADWMSLTGDLRVLSGALAAVASDRLVLIVRDRFIRKVESDLEVTTMASPATLATLPAGSGRPASIALQGAVEDHDLARAGATLATAYAPIATTRPPEDQTALLRLLSDETKTGDQR